MIVATVVQDDEDGEGLLDERSKIAALRREHQFYAKVDRLLEEQFDVAWNTQNMWGFLEEIGCPSVGENGPLREDTYDHIPSSDNTFRYLYAAYHHVMAGLLLEEEETETDGDGDGDENTPPNIIIPPNYKRPSVPLRGYTPALHPSVEPRHVPGKGRGLIATEAIPKGTMVWSAKNAAEFPTSQTYYEFLRVLHQMDYTEWYWNTKNHEKQPKETKEQRTDEEEDDDEGGGSTQQQELFTFTPRLVCDAVLWSYTARGGYMSELGLGPWTKNNDSEEKNLDGTFYYLVCIDFDEGSMINGADRETDSEEEREDPDSIINVAEKPPEGYKIGTQSKDSSSSSASASDDEQPDEQKTTTTTATATTEKYHFGCQGSAMYATRDIPKGAELRMDYWDSAVPAGWAYLNLGWW